MRFERDIATAFGASVFVSREEAALFATLAPESAARTHHVNNGVDAEYFSPDINYHSPYRDDEDAVVFTGAMDYWPNADAACWFSEEIFPLVLDQHPRTSFYIVGGRPLPAVKDLEKHAKVHVTGRVDDIRPYIAPAAVAVAPLRIARGVQNKVLEAMAMGKAVVGTQAAMEGIEACPGITDRTFDSSDDFADRVVQLLQHNDGDAPGADGRRFVVENYDWERNLSRMEQLLAKRPDDSHI